MRCEEVREMLPAFADGDIASLEIRRHLSECSACHTELARYGSLLDGLSDLRVATAPAPAGLLRSLVAIPSRTSRVDQVRTHIVRNRAAYAGAATAAVLGAAGAALWRFRRQRLALA